MRKLRWICTVESVTGIGVGLIAILFSVTPARAQNAALAGVVKDSSGAVIPQTSVTLTNQHSGISVSTQSDAGGRFEFLTVVPGTYSLKAERQGFKSHEQSPIRLEVDERSRLDIALEVGNVAETVTVTAEVPLVRTLDASVGGVVENRRIMEMPLNGRFFLDLANLLPATVHSTNPRTFLATGTAAGAFGINTAGAREDQVNFLVEGIDLNDMAQNQMTFQPNIEFVQEFKIQASSFSAELGRSSGAVIYAVMRSGTNNLHGDVYEFFRNDVLDARNFFDQPRPVAKQLTGREISPFKRNIFGAAVGGPIRIPGVYDGRNRTVFFATYEGRRQAESETLRARVPTAAELAGITNPVVRSLVSLLPRENASLPFNFVSSGGRTRTLDQMTGKVDHQFAGSDHLAGTYLFQRDSRVEPSNIGANNIPGFGDFRPARRQFLAVNASHLFGPRAVNEFRFGFNRVRISFVGQTKSDASAVGLNTGETGPTTLPRILVPGLLSFGNPANFPQGRADTTFQYSDVFSLRQGSHSLKFGGEIRRVWNNNFDAATRGQVEFNTFADFLAGNVRRFTKAVGEVSPGLRVLALNTFVQDDWTVRSHFTLSLGLRYELNAVPSEIHKRQTIFDPAAATLHRIGEPGFSEPYHSDTNNIGPRAGFAWDPFGHGKTAVRASYGIFYDQPTANVVGPGRISGNPPFRTTFDYDSVTVNNLFGAAGAPRSPVLTNVDRNFRSDYVQEWNFNIQQEVVTNTRLEVSYVGSKGTGLRLLRDINARAPSPAGTGPRPFPAFGRINQEESASKSNYNALWVSLQRRLPRGLLFTANYAWSKSMDLNSVGSANPQIQNPQNLRAERAVSDFDARHRVTVSAIYELPFHLGHTPAIARRALTGWQLSGVMTLQSGSPVAPLLTADRSGTGDFFDRPNRVGDAFAPGPGCPKTRTPACWFNPSAFALPPAGQFGNAGRNILVGPGLNDFDLGAFKNNRIGERYNIQFRAQIYNLFNHPNFGSPTLAFSAPTPANPNPSNFGVVRATRAPRGDASSSRQIEFGLKFYY